MPDGSDPMPKVPIYYDFLNVGDWLSIATTGGGGALFELDVNGNINLFSTDAASYAQIISGTGGFNFQTTGQAEIGATNFDFNASDAGFNVIAAGAVTLRSNDGGIELTIHKAGDTFTIKNHAGNAKIQWIEGDPNLYIPTGGTVIASL